MSSYRLYLSLIPQGLIASMLEPDDFGSYYALGGQVHSRGEAIFFEVDASKLPDGEFPLELADERCRAKPDGSPKKSLYLAIYRVLSRVPVDALGTLYLVTRDGQTLALERGDYHADMQRKAHLYQEFCPIDPLVVSCLEPREFCRMITDVQAPVHVPRIVFSQLALRGLDTDPEGAPAQDLPYPNLQYLRETLAGLLGDENKHSKLFVRQAIDGVYYRTIRGGFYVGDQHDFAFYPFPSPQELEDRHYAWWRAAQLS